MYIRKFLLVSYIASVIVFIGEVYYDEVSDWIKGLSEDILFEVFIPRINLKKFVYNMDSSLNNVDSNVKILNNSNIDKKLFYLASHSGSGRASYFDNLVYLEKGDFIWLKGNKVKYCFVVDEMFYIQKKGYFEFTYNDTGDILFLVTCSLKYVDRQLVVKANLVYIS